MRMTDKARCLALPVAVLALAAPAAASVQVGSSGWRWGNPLPQGNTIRTMAFAGGVGYAGGDFGTLLKTTDGGRSWTGLRVGTFQALTTVQALDAGTVFAGGGCVARRSDDGGQTFRRVAFTNVESACRERLVGLSFVDRDTGWILETDGTVVQTRDGGAEFIQRTAVPGARAAGGAVDPTDVAFVSATKGFATTADGKVFQTTDEGVSWRLVADVGRRLNDVMFLDADHGFAVGERQLLLRTEDGGATWAARELQSGGSDLAAIRCATPLLCVVTTARGDQLVRTEDAGETSAPISASTDPIYAAAFASASDVAAAGASGASVVSADAGVNFTPVGGRLSGSYHAVLAGGHAGSAYALGDNGALAITADSGATWVRGNVATSEDVQAASFPTAQAGYALDVAGGLFRTHSAGESWSALDSGAKGIPAALHAPRAGIVLTIGPRGVRRSRDDGETFAAARRLAGVELHGVDRAGAAIVAYGSQRIYRSTDEGASWRRVGKPRRRLGVSSVDFTSARQGYLLDEHGRLWRTADGGRTYARRYGAGTAAVGMAFASARSGYLVIRRFGDDGRAAGYLLRTSDAGATWRPQFVVDTPIGSRGIATSGGATDYLLGGATGLLSTTSGGDAGARSSISLRTARRRLARGRTIAVTGRLRPASGFERVTVSWLPPGSDRWRRSTVQAASNGRFTTNWTVGDGVHRFVAQWSGDFTSAGAGSSPVTVRVRR